MLGAVRTLRHLLHNVREIIHSYVNKKIMLLAQWRVSTRVPRLANKMSGW